MTTILVALDNSLASKPVVETGVALGTLLGARLEAVHVVTGEDRVARGAADAAGLPLRLVTGPVADRLLEAGRDPDVAALVLGARGTPGGRPLGGTALAVATSLEKPVVVVAPDSRTGPLRRALVPVEAGRSSALTPRAIVELAVGTRLEVVVLHVLDEGSLPPFTDQPQHEHTAWTREYLRRYCPWGVGVVGLETRVGRIEELLPLVAEETDSDIVALGWAQEIALDRAPVVRTTLLRSRVPVMLVPVKVEAPAAARPEPLALTS